MVDVVDKKTELTSANKELLAIKKEFNEISYQFANLYERWSVEHKHVAKREAEMARAIEAFNKKVEDLSELEENIKSHAEDAAKEAVIGVKSTISSLIRESFTGELRVLEDDLDNLCKKFKMDISNANSVVYSAKEILRKYEDIEFLDFVKSMVLVILVGVIVGALSAWIVK